MRSAAEIESILSAGLVDFMEKHKIPGLSLGVVLNGEAALAKGFGVKETSMFHSASISKTFVATALMQLFEKGLLDLEGRVTEYLPYFKLKDERYKSITIRQMLNHTSGMPDVHDYEWDKPQYDEEALERYVKSLYDNELLWEPGERFAYSNIAYEVLGDVIAKISGMPFEAYMEQNVFKPLDMKKTSYLIKDIPREIITTPHVMDICKGYNAKVSEYYPYNRIHAPSSTLWCNAVEMCQYAIAALNRGKYGDRRLLQSGSYDVMWQPAAETGRDSSRIGFSWFLREHKEVGLVYHTGGDTGYLSNLVLIPEKNAAFSMFCNCDYLNLSLITGYILDVILGNDVMPLKTSVVPSITATMAEQGIDAADAKFEKLRTENKDEYYVSDAELNRLAYRYKQNGMEEKGLAVLQMGIREYPCAANLYDSLGEFYLDRGERDKAVSCYRKSVELNPHNSSGISALKRLGY